MNDKDKAVMTLDGFSTVLKNMLYEGKVVDGLTKQSMKEISESIDTMNEFYVLIKKVVM